MLETITQQKLTEIVLTHQKDPCEDILAFLTQESKMDWQLYLPKTGTQFLSLKQPFTTLEMPIENQQMLLRLRRNRKGIAQDGRWVVAIEQLPYGDRLAGLLVSQTSLTDFPLAQQCATLLASFFYFQLLSNIAQPSTFDQEILAWITGERQIPRQLDRDAIEMRAKIAGTRLEDRHVIALFEMDSQLYPSFAASIKRQFPGSLACWQQSLLCWIDTTSSSWQDLLVWLHESSHDRFVLGGLSSEITVSPAPSAYDEALQALEFAKNQHPQESLILPFSQIGARFAFLSVDTSGNHYRFIQKVAAFAPKLLPSLEAYVQRKNAKEAATSTALAYTTLVGHIKLLETYAQEYGVSLEDWFEVTVALKMWQSRVPSPFEP